MKATTSNKLQRSSSFEQKPSSKEEKSESTIRSGSLDQKSTKLNYISEYENPTKLTPQKEPFGKQEIAPNIFNFGKSHVNNLKQIMQNCKLEVIDYKMLFSFEKCTSIQMTSLDQNCLAHFAKIIQNHLDLLQEPPYGTNDDFSEEAQKVFKEMRTIKKGGSPEDYDLYKRLYLQFSLDKYYTQDDDPKKTKLIPLEVKYETQKSNSDPLVLKTPLLEYIIHGAVKTSNEAFRRTITIGEARITLEKSLMSSSNYKHRVVKFNDSLYFINGPTYFNQNELRELYFLPLEQSGYFERVETPSNLPAFIPIPNTPENENKYYTATCCGIIKINNKGEIVDCVVIEKSHNTMTEKKEFL